MAARKAGLGAPRTNCETSKAIAPIGQRCSAPTTVPPARKTGRGTAAGAAVRRIDVQFGASSALCDESELLYLRKSVERVATIVLFDREAVEALLEERRARAVHAVHTPESEAGLEPVDDAGDVGAVSAEPLDSVARRVITALNWA